MIAKLQAFRRVSGWGWWLMVAGQALIACGQETASDANSILVMRDLTVISPVVVAAISADGVVLDDARRIAWYDILVAQRWQTNSEQLERELTEEAIQRYLGDYGQDWFFVLNRRRRGEVWGVANRLHSLRERYVPANQELAGQAAVEFLLSQQYAAQGELAAAATAWFYWQEHHHSFKSSPAWHQTLKPWLEHYVDITPLEPEQSLGIPNHLPPFNLQVDEKRLAEWRICKQVPQTAIFELVAAVETGDLQQIATAEQRLQMTLPLWNESQRPVVHHLLKSVEVLKRWHSEPELYRNDEVRLGYLDLEQRWLESFTTTDSPQPTATTIREQIVWQLYLEGLYLLSRPDQRLEHSGLLRWMLLKHWSVEYPMIAAKNAVMGPELHRSIARRSSTGRQ